MLAFLANFHPYRLVLSSFKSTSHWYLTLSSIWVFDLNNPYIFDSNPCWLPPEFFNILSDDISGLNTSVIRFKILIKSLTCLMWKTVWSPNAVNNFKSNKPIQIQTVKSPIVVVVENFGCTKKTWVSGYRAGSRRLFSTLGNRYSPVFLNLVSCN